MYCYRSCLWRAGGVCFFLCVCVSGGGRKFLAPPYYSQRSAQCLRLSERFFSFTNAERDSGGVPRAPTAVHGARTARHLATDKTRRAHRRHRSAFCYFFCFFLFFIPVLSRSPFSALTLLVGGHPACKTLGVGLLLITFRQVLCTSYSSSSHHQLQHLQLQ